MGNIYVNTNEDSTRPIKFLNQRYKRVVMVIVQPKISVRQADV